MKKTIMTIIITIVIILSVEFLILVWLDIYKFNFTNDNTHVACTMEAKLCPDGSAVGRSGPNCEFAPCPGE